MLVAILFNAPLLPPEHADYASEAGVLESVAAMERALQTAGQRAVRVDCGTSPPLLLRTLDDLRPDVVINLCEGFAGQSRHEAHVAAMLELLETPYTGSPPECLSLVQDKPRAKRLLLGAGVATAHFIEITRHDAAWQELHREQLTAWLQLGPWLVKPAREDASLGITAESVVTDWPALQRQVLEIQNRYGDVLIERYLDGREFNVGIIALPQLQVLPVAEIEFQSAAELPWPIVTYSGKWHADSCECTATPAICPAEISPELHTKLITAAVAAYRATGCRDYARIDLRTDRAGNVFVLEVNANPDAATTAGLARMLRAAGVNYDQFVLKLVQTAIARGQSRAVPSPVKAPLCGTTSSSATIRSLQPSDIPALVELTRRTNFFRPDELDIAAEVLRDALAGKDDGHYRVHVAESENAPIGWSCHGRVPLTDGTFDLYWIVVAPEFQHAGIGRQLLAEVEQHVRNSGGRWLLAETSSTPQYAATRAFYARCGYRVVSDIADFYRPSDGRVTFGKSLMQ